MPKQAISVDVPHNVKMLPYHYFGEQEYQGIFTYEKTFDDEHPEMPCKFLHFSGVMLKFHVYLNGVDLGEFISGFLPVNIDITDAMKKEGNRLIVVVDSSEDPEIPPFGNVVDYLTFGGIYREVYIDHQPVNHAHHIYPVAKRDGSIEVSWQNEGKEVTPVFSLYDGEEKILEFEGGLAKLESPHLWSIDDPHLYRLVMENGRQVEEFKIGFRDIEWKEEGFFLNGEKIKLYGLNRHQSYPYFGMAAPKGLQYDDAYIIKKQFGCNVVRTSHYADDEAFLSACDELGLLVIDEIPGWQHIGQSQKWRDTCCEFTRKLIIKERIHPSLIAYGLRIDESIDDHELYSHLQDIQKMLDPHRLSTGVRNFKESEMLEDIYAYNDFSCASTEHGLDEPSSWSAAKGKPKIVSENNGHMFPTKSFDPTDRRVESALRHCKVLDDAFGYPDLTGSIAWCAFDYNTHRDFGSGDHICYHGVADIFRLPKYASFAYSSQGVKDFFEVASLMQLGDFDESLLRPAYVFTDADQVDLYKNGAKIASFKPDRQHFPHLPHPPIKVDDWIGDSFDEPGFSKKQAKRIVAAINYCSQHGFSRLKLSHKLYLAYIMMTKHLSFPDVQALYGKYTSSWGGKGSEWTFVGLKNGQEFVRKTIGTSVEFHYETTVSSNVIHNGATYDAVRVGILKKDQYGTTMPYADDEIEIELEGPIELMGPTKCHLVGGGTSLFVRSKPVKEKTMAKVIVKGESGRIEIELQVE